MRKLLFLPFLFMICMSCDNDSQYIETAKERLVGMWSPVRSYPGEFVIAEVLEFKTDNTVTFYYGSDKEEAYDFAFTLDRKSLYTTYREANYTTSYKYDFVGDTLRLECMDCGPEYIMGRKYIFNYIKVEHNVPH